MHPDFDEKDAAILAERQAAFDTRKGPRVGDFIVMPDKTLRRFTHDWGESIQTTCKPHEFGPESFYITEDGFASYSGALDPAIDKKLIIETESTKDGYFWFFHHNHVQAHNGVHATMPCRVYRITERPE